MRTIGTLVLGAALPLLAAASAWAECAPMTLESIPGTRETWFADRDGSGGTSAGDKRGGMRQLHAGDGALVGTHYWINTVHEAGADGTPQALAVDMVFTFADGALFAAETLEPSGEAFQAPESVAISRTPTFTIHGGTGAYAGASGTVALTIADGEASYRFDIACE